ncbi:MAG: hypothetical protein ACREIR_05730 [Geminicoccaceae bacterium]
MATTPLPVAQRRIIGQSSGLLQASIAAPARSAGASGNDRSSRHLDITGDNGSVVKRQIKAPAKAPDYKKKPGSIERYAWHLRLTPFVPQFLSPFENRPYSGAW